MALYQNPPLMVTGDIRDQDRDHRSAHTGQVRPAGAKPQAQDPSPSPSPSSGARVTPF